MDGDKSQRVQFSEMSGPYTDSQHCLSKCEYCMSHKQQSALNSWRGTGNSELEGRRKSGTDRPDGWEIDPRNVRVLDPRRLSCFSSRGRSHFLIFGSLPCTFILVFDLWHWKIHKSSCLFVMGLSKVLLQIACPECLWFWPLMDWCESTQYMPVAITIGLGINQMWVLNTSANLWANYLTSLSLTLSLGRVSNSLLRLKIKCSICHA